MLLDWARGAEVEVERAAGGQLVVSLPGEKKLKTVVSVRLGAERADLQAFVIRHADENEEAVYAWLLRRNAKLRGLAFSIDALGDIYLDASVPLAAWDEPFVDQLMGRLLSAADESFNELLVLGFLTSMKREWAWRIARGESTRNLQAFESLLSGPDNEFLGTFSAHADPAGQPPAAP
ncbi:YbjN domain-containing protein [Brevibacterium sp. 5221]|uniref:YbjN domain-containing protein n=1 Tax=Brevibacterium rongguiense TaxID=2695267 RepID=A0A6N9H8Z2_9MICO|nr:YbjN domain-containing protein [Brevibacterium rongguiense]